MIVLRPYPVLTLLTLMALAVLLALGGWQTQRMGWKSALMEEHAQAQSAAPAALDVLCGEPPLAGLPVAGARPDADRSVRVYGRSPEGAPGWRVFAPAPLPDCAQARWILAETGFEPLSSAGAGAGAVPSGPAARGVRLEPPQRPGAFGAPDAPARGEFHAFNRAAMAQALEMQEEALLDAWWLARDDGRLPAWLAATPPERHGAYALTWYLMALALIAVWGAFHVTRGRLGLRGKD
ncbi:SURF1 family protein [Alkalicaulis satelles]|uniref:SURF1-like protein n=1 Tax=Alkalicaulis satelles TaxID=2609175 RepID=A0A5M6ZA83_9PROT|nr:SURF1 family protein [Alkalicaulis satelles]KAA5801619.1 SURF1 family protein [Alkalicaulis satelles]